ncbi:LamG-like jellyroll fold domain-containing protein [Phytohabitans rumicis]|uniref:LamG-like jellyroll fold domain-containing protein n=1 Tax=Phytohabitans rumicis TaxID=1076125 RepID=A0A6V8LGH6_9ACTN|nr:LamG-like jellyroll fold domain-containing protein [Phytohabitans rumicis]GFJ93699.1 hypothetical protein Prum_073410 [Phytohabitans rumicis]
MWSITGVRRWIRTVATITVVGLVCGTAAGPAAADLPDDPGVRVPRPGDSGSERATAQAEAAKTRQRVEVVGDRSESGQVFANPDGSFTSEMSMAPVRVRRAGGWVPVDTTLEARPDGTVAPKAVPPTLAFSGGGTVPLVRLGKDAHELVLTWPDALPTAKLDGDTAVYPDVLPGVDLRMRATAYGFSQLLVVKTKQAAANQALATISLGLSTTGLSVSADEIGNLRAEDGAGKLIFGASAPLMWDSTPPPDAATAGLAGPDRPGARQAVSEVAVGQDRLVLRPDQKLLSDPATTYPVYIDPDFTEGALGWTLVLEGVTQPKWNGANDTTPILGKSGYSTWDGPAVKYRTYFQFNTAQALGTALKSAQFRVMEVWAPSCTATWVQAYGTAPIHQGTNWDNQPSREWAVGIGEKLAAYGHPNCAAAQFLEWDAFGAVQESLRRGLGTTTIMLQARDERDINAWKKWLVNADSPKLTVTYNRYPDRPYGLTVEHKPCAQVPNQPYVNPLNPNDQPAGPTLRAYVSDQDGGLVRAGFQWSLADGSRPGGVETTSAYSTSHFGAQIPSWTFNDGETFRYRVVGLDPMDSGPWTDYCYATIDRTRPPAPAAVSSATYPENDIGGSAGFTAGFTFRAPVPSDVAGFLYGLHDQPTQFAPANRVQGVASALVTPPDNGPHTLYVYSVDRANNVSSTRYEYHFTVGRGTPPVAHWRLDGLTDTQVLDSRPQRHDGAVTFGPAKWHPGRRGDALFLDGSTGAYVNTGNGPAVRTDASFSVAAWVKLGQAGTTDQVIVSQDGNQPSEFTLQYAGDVKKWALTMAQSDTANTAWDRVLSDAVAQADVWTHLVGTYDPSSGDMRLYQNGVLQAQVGKHSNRRPVSNGTVQLGRGKANGGYTGYWRGGIDDVQLYSRVITAREAYEQASAPTEELFLPLDEGAGTTATDISGAYRSVQLGAGASWTPGADIIGEGTAVRLGGTSTGVATAGLPAVRTDQSFMVSAQVWLDPAVASGTGTLTAVSQDGPLSSGFTLGYNRATRGWTFALSPADAASPVPIAADSSAVGRTASPATWTHLLGSYDAATGEVKLYVDGEPTDSSAGRSTANVTGRLVLGRDWRNGQAAGFWHGAIDDVHAWTGVNEAVGLAAFYAPVSQRRSAYDGQLNRFLTLNPASMDHMTVPGGAARYYHFEGSLGAFAPADAENTRMLYLCRVGGDDEFTSPDAACENQEVLGPLGRVYRDPPPDQPSLAIYRCLVVEPGVYSDHFDSTDPLCEGKQTEFKLGYTRPYIHLVRYTSPTYPYDHTSSTLLVAADYLPEGSLGRLAMHSGDGRVALWSCLDGADSFLSNDTACEGKTVVRRMGWIWPTPPANFASRELFRCRASWGDLFESTNPACEGQTVLASVGFVAVGL